MRTPDLLSSVLEDEDTRTRIPSLEGGYNTEIDTVSTISSIDLLFKAILNLGLAFWMEKGYWT